MKTVIRKSFKRELFLCFIVVALVPMVVTGCFLVNVLKARLSRDYEEKTQEQLISVENRLAGVFDEMDRAAREIMSDKVIVDGITQTDSWLKNKAYKRLYEKTQDLRETAWFHIYDAEGFCGLSTSPQGAADELPPYWGLLKVARTHSQEMILRRASWEQGSEKICLQGARAILDENEECLGFVVMDITEDHFETILSGTYNEENGIAVLNSYWEDVYSTKAAKEVSLAQTLRTRRMAGEDLRQTTDGITFYIAPLGQTGLYIILGKEPVFTRDVTDMTVGVMMIMAVCSLFLCIAAAGVMSNYLTAPVKKLSQAMARVEGGDLDVQVGSGRKDEFGQLSASFDGMTRQIKENLALQVKQQKELNDSNIAMMQAQLNPHFLYNTLDTIKWVAKAHHVPELATLASGLAKILRTSISEAQFISLSEEVSLVCAYMDIQKIRFDGNFSYDVELPLELEDCMVPKMIIQPIVENAIIHGLKERKNGHIFLNIYEEEETLSIEVYDDGCGMDETILGLLKERNREELKGHIGFYNVDTIIRLHYGTQYGLYAENQPEGGARVRITLPKVKRSSNAYARGHFAKNF